MRSWSKFFLYLFLFILTNCGVKGSPTPPIHPPFIGTGKPISSIEGIGESQIQNPKGATQEIKGSEK